MLKKFNMAEANCLSAPASREESKNHKDVSAKVPHLKAVGSIMYLAAATHPKSHSPQMKLHASWTDQLTKNGTKLNAFVATCDQPATMTSGILEVLAN